MNFEQALDDSTLIETYQGLRHISKMMGAPAACTFQV